MRNIEHAFLNCVNLTEITLYNKVEIISSDAFIGCQSLTDVYYYGTVEDWNKTRILGNDETLLNATIHFLGEHKWVHINVPSTCSVPDVKYTVSYSSSNDSVATVDANGNVTTRGTGTATITVTVTDEYGNRYL